MSRQHWLAIAIVCSGMLFDPQAARAQQTVNLSLGYFTVRGQDARVAGDVLNANRNFLTFDVNDFNGGSIGGEWLFPVGRYIEAGAGMSFGNASGATVGVGFARCAVRFFGAGFVSCCG